MLHEGSGKGGGIGGLEVNNDGEGSEVAHGGKDVFAATVAGNVAWLPDVNVDDGKRGGDWPRVNQFTVPADAGVGKDAIGAGFEPCFHVGAELVPVEAEADAVECFVGHEMSSRG